MKKKSEYFNIIIDDGSHKYHDILSNFKKFFKKIKPGGYYIIEDFNHYKLHPSYINDAPKKGLDIDVILDHLNRKEFFEILSKYFDVAQLSSDWDSLKTADEELLVNSLAILCPFDPEEKQALLEAPSLQDRRETLVTLMEMTLKAGPNYGPIQ